MMHSDSKRVKLLTMALKSNKIALRCKKFFEQVESELCQAQALEMFPCIFLQKRPLSLLYTGIQCMKEFTLTVNSLTFLPSSAQA